MVFTEVVVWVTVGVIKTNFVEDTYFVKVEVIVLLEVLKKV